MKTVILETGSNEKGDWATVRVIPRFGPAYTITFGASLQFFYGPNGERPSTGLDEDLWRIIESRKVMGLHSPGDAYPTKGLCPR